MNSSADLSTDTDATATSWVIRQEQGPLSPDERRQFEAWLGRDEAHRAAYVFAQDAWRRLDRLSDEPDRFADEFAAMARNAAPAARPGLRLAGGLAAMAASLVVAVIGMSVWFGNPLTRLRADHATGPTQIAAYDLPDGSRADLAPDSAIALDFTENERRVTLLTGSAYFTVAPASAAGNRPFVVHAGQGNHIGRVRALGTQFAVEQRGDSVTVTVTEHAVEVVAPIRGDSRLAVVREGQGVTYDGNGLRAPATVKAEQTTAWHRRQLVFDRQSVTEVAAELSRYRRGSIVVRNPALAQKQFSGVLDIGDVDGALRIVAEELKAEVTLLPFVAILQ